MTTESEHEEHRRCYESGLCPYHKILEKQVSNSLPRWVFNSAFGTFIMAAIVFAGWHVRSLEEFDNKYSNQVVEFNRLASENRNLLIEVKTNQVAIMKFIERDERR